MSLNHECESHSNISWLYVKTGDFVQSCK